MDSSLLGAWGEKLAVKYYRKDGYKCTASGYRSRFGEIDIIAENRDDVVFSEAKLRKNSDVAAAREFVDFRKQEKIRKTAILWLTESGCEKQPRFDVVEIYAPEGIKTKRPEINLIENAF